MSVSSKRFQPSVTTCTPLQSVSRSEGFTVGMSTLLLEFTAEFAFQVGMVPDAGRLPNQRHDG
eukprot:5016056-Amphidinium_carterae.1